MKVDASAFAQKFFWILLPIWALLIFKSLRHQSHYYILHLIFAGNLFATYLFTWLIIATIVFVYPYHNQRINSYQTLFVNVPFSIFTFLSIKNAYKISWLKTFKSWVFIVPGFPLLIILFRQSVSLCAFWLITK